MARRIAIIQSNYIPWRGYFDLIDDVDVLVVYDDVQFTKNDWRNRNIIKISTGTQWLTVPVRRPYLKQSIDEVEIASEQPWRRVHQEAIRSNYGRAAFFASLFPSFQALLDSAPGTLSALNRGLIGWAMDVLDIETKVVDVRALSAPGRRTERLLAIVRELGGDTYLSGPSAAAYLDVEAFRSQGIRLEYKSYAYEPYRQLWGTFEGAVSIIDLLFNAGPEARRFLKSTEPNLRVV